METFVFIWQLLEEHGVIPSKRREAEQLWNSYSLEQQRYIYRCIRDKLRQDKFVHYNPVQAIKENAPKAPRLMFLSADEYYRRYGTTADCDGWTRRFLPEQHKTIYYKQSKSHVLP